MNHARVIALLGTSLLTTAACGDGGSSGDDDDDDIIGQPDATTSGVDATAPDAAGPLPDADIACQVTTAGAPWIAFASNRNDDYDIFRIRTDGSCLVRITTYPTDDLAPAWRPGDHVVAFTGQRDGTISIYTRDQTGGSDVRLDVGSLQATTPAWSPDGTWIAFEGRIVGELETSIYKIAFPSGSPVRLTDSGANDSGPVWSLDGETIYFVSNRGGSYEIYSMAADGSAETAVTTGSGILGRPTLSADGATLAYARPNASTADPEIVLHTIASSATRVLTSQHDSEPAYDPAGAAIAVSSYRFGGPEVVILNSDSGAVIERLTTDPASDGAPAYAVPSP